VTTANSALSDSWRDTGDMISVEQGTITVWSDIACPWATLALRAAAHNRGRDVLIDHRAFPLELFNKMPTPKLIIDAEIVAIASSQAELGLRMWADTLLDLVPDTTAGRASG
jgi:predicted DsbA family dithiol-disulfide isomerase